MFNFIFQTSDRVPDSCIVVNIKNIHLVSYQTSTDHPQCRTRYRRYLNTMFCLNLCCGSTSRYSRFTDRDRQTPNLTARQTDIDP